MPGSPGDWVGVIQRIATAAGLAVAQRVLYFGDGFTVFSLRTVDLDRPLAL